MNQVRRHRPVEGANRDVHRAGPIHAEADRIGVHEIVVLIEHLHRVTSVAGEAKRLRQRQPVLAAAHLPRKLDVRQAGTHLEKIPFAIRHALGKAQALHRIEIPVDRPVAAASFASGIDGHERAAAEQVEFVRDRAIGGGHDRGRLLGILLRDSPRWSRRTGSNTGFPSAGGLPAMHRRSRRGRRVPAQMTAVAAARVAA